jgi:23S rRNA pseudouridine2605 synthase
MRNKPSSGGRKDNDRKPFNKEGGRTERTQGGKPPYKKTDGRHRDDDRPRRDFDKGEGRGKRNFEDNDRPKRSFDRQGDKPARSYGDKPRRNFEDNTDRPKRSFDRDDRPKRSFGNDSDRPKRSFDKQDDRPKRSFGNDSERPRRSFDDNNDRPKRSFNSDGDRPKRSFDKKDDRNDRSYGDRPKRSFNDDGDRPQRPKRNFDDNSERPKRSFDKNGDKPKRSFKEETERPKGRFEFDEEVNKKPRKEKEKLNPFDERMSKAFHADKKKEKLDDSSETLRTFEEADKSKLSIKDPEKGIGGEGFDQAFPLGARKVSGPFRKQFEKDKQEGFKNSGKRSDRKTFDEPEEMTLNKYIAHSGQCSRREAAELVKKGKVKVNDELMLDPGYRVKAFDTVTIAGKKLTPQKNRAYILLNKPKDYITTNDDPEGRRTVMDLVDDAGVDRLFPVGRLDRNTTGLLLLTNDGDLAQKLSHPSYEVKKVYQATLDKPLTKADFEKIVSGIELEDGPVHVDELAYLEQKNELGLEIHSGRNRIVRRIFESLGYQVEKLDRVMYAGLTKKNLPRGQWRFLSDKEVILLKHFKS